MSKLPKKQGLYAALVIGADEMKPEIPNAIIEICGNAPYLQAVIHTLNNCNHPLLRTGSRIDGRENKHIIIGRRISLLPG
jgi:hypothetical protein